MTSFKNLGLLRISKKKKEKKIVEIFNSYVLLPEEILNLIKTYHTYL